MRQVVNAVCYLLTTGGQWRMLPHDYPKWQRIYYYVRTWRDDSTWRRIHDTLRAQVGRRTGRHKHATAGCLDSQSVKASAHRGVRGYASGKKVQGRKSGISWSIPWAC